MTPGPTLIMKAPGCEKPVKFRTIASGNTFGATFWTDGKRDAPMLPDQPWLRKSPSEGVLFWSDECEQIGEYDWYRGDKTQNEEWKDLEFAEEPSEADYFAALTSGIASTEEKMRYVRMRLWWAGNDAIRKGEAGTLPEPHLQNLAAFVEVLSDTDPNQRMMKAEALRELGRFEEAVQLLDYEFPKGYQVAVSRVRALCEARDIKVAELK